MNMSMKMAAKVTAMAGTRHAFSRLQTMNRFISPFSFQSPSKRMHVSVCSAVDGVERDPLYNPTEEHLQLREMVADFALREVHPQARTQDDKGVLNSELFSKLGELGLFGITIPVEHGGVGMDTVASVIVHHELSKYDAGFALAYLAHSVLFVHNLYHNANDEQRQRYLPKTISGEWIGAMGMTEPGAGTDVLGMSATAMLSGDEYILNGQKTYITNACEAECFIVYAKLDGKITSFIADRSMEGISTGQHIDKCGMRGSTMADVFFEDCRIPKSNLLGEEGQGMITMMRNLEIERLVLAAMSVGIAERCIDTMVEWSNQRQAFGQTINRYGQIQRYIGESYAKYLAAKALVYSVARQVGYERQNRVGSDAAKLFATPVGKEVADSAMQVLGGIGYCKETDIERLWRDAKLLEIGGGTLEAHHKNLTKDLTRILTTLH